ncbi:MAG TPA: hypothetical protein PLZ51_18805 [Aggregatilineales bacterium]|nr:hypothetical protein [Aggregatilineales bacterium]
MSQNPSISILLPTHRAVPQNRGDPTRLKNLIHEATAQLLEKFPQEQVAPIIEKLNNIPAIVDFQKTQGGLAIYVNASFEAIYSLPFAVQEQVHIGKIFATRDLIYALNRTLRYWLLVLNEKQTHLYIGTKNSLEEITNADFPLTSERKSSTNKLQDMSDIQEVEDYVDDYHRQLFHKIDAAFSAIATHDRLPLVVVGTERLLKQYQAVSRNVRLITATLKGNHDNTSPYDLREVVYPLLMRILTKERDAVLETDLTQAENARPFVSGIEAVWRMTHEKHGGILLVETNYRVAGCVDNTGRYVASADAPNATVVMDNVVDAVIELVIQTGGHVHFVDDGVLANHEHIVLVMK